MKLYHGTSSENLGSMMEDGVDSPSYWGTRRQAEAYAASYGANGVLLEAELDTEDLKASIYVAQAMYDDGDIDTIPDEDDLAYSLQHLGGLTCHARVRQFKTKAFRPELDESHGIDP